MIMMTCNVVTPQLFWFKKIRTSFAIAFVMSFFINIGMWFERFVIIVTSLHRDYLPSSWTMFHPTFIDIGIFVGTIGIFFTLFLLFARVFPVIAQAETKSILKEVGSQYYRANGIAAPAPIEESAVDVSADAAAKEEAEAKEEEGKEKDSDEEGQNGDDEGDSEKNKPEDES